MILELELDELHEAMVMRRVESGEYPDGASVMRAALDALVALDGATLDKLKTMKFSSESELYCGAELTGPL